MQIHPKWKVVCQIWSRHWPHFPKFEFDWNNLKIMNYLFIFSFGDMGEEHVSYISIKVIVKFWLFLFKFSSWKEEGYGVLD